MARTEKEIEVMIDKVLSHDTKYSGMSYEDGIRDALDWVLGNGETLEETYGEATSQHE